MVAAASFLDPTLAKRAEADFVAIFLHPFFKILTQSVIAADVFAVPGLFTTEADLSTTGWAVKLLFLVILSAHMSLAACLRTPTHQRVRLQLFF